MSRPRVLIVDDDPELRSTLREVLEDGGCDAVCREGGAAALGYLRGPERRPDVILLDLMMPGMSGWEFRERQLADPSLAEIPVVVMTASRDVQGITADKLLFKPVHLAELLRVVESYGAQSTA